jgi:hypothetical protein
MKKPKTLLPNPACPSFSGEMRSGCVLSKRRFSYMAVAWLGTMTIPSLAQPALLASHAHVLPQARSLPVELAAALHRGSALVVMVSLQGCAYCRIVREQYLAPLAQQGLPVVQVDWRSPEPLQDFSEHGSHDDATRRWKIRVAPTLLFFGPEGREVAPRLVGVTSLDFYGAYLDARLQEARRTIRF